MDTSTEKIIQLEPLVTVTMTTYNRGTYIEQAIKSVIEQTYRNWELIIVDDGSSDGTQTMVEGFGDSRIRYLRHDTNKGIYQTRTDALAAARGTYIAVLDSDDAWADTTKLSKQVAFLESHPDYAIVGTFITLIDGDGAVIGSDSYAEDDAGIRAQILRRNQFAHSSVLMHKSLIDQVGGYRNIPLAEDLDLFLRIGALGTQAKFANIPEYMTLYRVHTGSITKSKLPLARCVHSIIKTYRNQYPNYVLALIKSYLRLFLAGVR